MRYVELSGKFVRYVLPPELAADYTILPLDSVKIALDAIVAEGDIYEDGEFRTPIEVELKADARPVFNAERSRLFVATKWIRERHSDRIEMVIDDKVNWKAWLNYWQALRDMPQQSDFDSRNPKWPIHP